MPQDIWYETSQDLIERFLDVLRTEYDIPAATCAEYQTELYRLDTWMRQAVRRTLVTAQEEDLGRYLFREVFISAHTLGRALRAMRRFYTYARAMRFREDDPTPRPVQLVWDADAPPLEPLLQQEPGASVGAARALSHRFVTALARACGVRHVEMRDLTITDLALDKGYLIVGTRRPRVILLSARTIGLLRWFLEHVRPVLVEHPDWLGVFPARRACRVRPPGRASASGMRRHRQSDTPDT